VSPSMTFAGGECKLFWFIFSQTVSVLVRISRRRLGGENSFSYRGPTGVGRR
jgi:hypothetical protein